MLKKEVGEGWEKHIIATTDHEKGNLIKLAKEHGFELFYIPSSVGGRFSELSPVGLLPAAACGIDTVSYTHLDVYKRQHLTQTLIFLHGSSPLSLFPPSLYRRFFICQ